MGEARAPGEGGRDVGSGRLPPELQGDPHRGGPRGCPALVEGPGFGISGSRVPAPLGDRSGLVRAGALPSGATVRQPALSATALQRGTRRTLVSQLETLSFRVASESHAVTLLLVPKVPYSHILLPPPDTHSFFFTLRCRSPWLVSRDDSHGPCPVARPADPRRRGRSVFPPRGTRVRARLGLTKGTRWQ